MYSFTFYKIGYLLSVPRYASSRDSADSIFPIRKFVLLTNSFSIIVITDILLTFVEKRSYMGDNNKIIRFDWAAKRLLRNKANFGVLEGFLTVLLDEKITIVEILESEGNQIHADDKFNRVDIKARNSKDEIVIIEIQNTREAWYLERILYGVAKTITEHISLGDKYNTVKKVYSINILYFDLGIGLDYLYHGQNSFVGVHTGDKLVINTRDKDVLVQKKPEEIFPEYFLIRVNEFNKVAVTPLEEWVAYLKDGVITPGTSAPGLEEARQKLQYYSMSEEERHAYDEHMNAIMIQNDVISTAHLEGCEEGEMKKAKEIARKMKLTGLSIEMIEDMTGLTKNEIENL